MFIRSLISNLNFKIKDLTPDVPEIITAKTENWDRSIYDTAVLI